MCVFPFLGCNAIRNGWLDPTVVGSFDQSSILEVRESLSLEDTPSGIPGSVYPSAEDLELQIQDYPISGGDTLDVTVHELQQRQIPYREQVPVSSSGFVNLPVLGRIEAVGLTTPELEGVLKQSLQDRGILVNPQVTVNPLFLSKATYSVFGIGVSASNNAPLRAGTFPITRPDLRVLEAINQVGGLNEFVTDVYIFRSDNPFEAYPLRSSDEKQGSDALTGEKDIGEPILDSQVEAGDGDRHEMSRGSSQAGNEVGDLLDAVEKNPPVDQKSDGDDILEALEEAQIDPYIYSDGQWLPNPKFDGPKHTVTPVLNSDDTFDLATPAAKWARIAGESSYRILQIPADALRSGDPEANIYVRAGDVLRIVSGEIGVYYVMGQVVRVGAFPFNSEKITLKSAIAVAGGLAPLAWPDRCTVYRKLGQREQMLQVDLDRIFAGKEPDFLIRRGDIINVGTHPFAPFLQRIRGLTLPNITSNLGYSFTYARNFADIDSFDVQRNPRNDANQFPNLNLLP